MSTDRDVERIVRSWMQDGVTALPDRVLDGVLEQLPTTPQRRAGWLAWRFPPMSNAVRIALAAAAVLVVAFLGIRFFGPLSTGGPSQTATPSPAPLPAAGQLEPGRYEMSDPLFTPLRFTFTVPAGWATNKDGFVIKHDGEPGEVAFTSFIVTHVYANACHWTGTSTRVGPTVDELANALAGQAERQTSGPTGTTLGGNPGKRIDLSASSDFPIATCVNQFIRTWPDAGGDENGGWGARDGQSDSVFVVDVNGTRVVIDAWHFPGTSETDITEIEGIIASIRFTP